MAVAAYGPLLKFLATPLTPCFDSIHLSYGKPAPIKENSHFNSVVAFLFALANLDLEKSLRKACILVGIDITDY